MKHKDTFVGPIELEIMFVCSLSKFVYMLRYNKLIINSRFLGLCQKHKVSGEGRVMRECVIDFKKYGQVIDLIPVPGANRV